MFEREHEAHAVRRDTMTSSLQESIRTQVRTREGSAAMDDKPLDTQLERTTRNLVTGASRRRVLQGAIGGAAGGLGLLVGRPAATAEPGLGDLTAATRTADRAGVQPEETDMTNNPNELTIENSALVLIDHQPLVALMVDSIDHSVLINNVTGLAQAAAVLGVPTVLTTVGAQGSGLADPIFKEISDAFPDITPIDRQSVHAWSHPDVRAAVDATGRNKLIMAGLVTEVCLAQSVLAARKDGFDVYFVSDCSGGATQEGHDDAKVRMTMAGAKPITWGAVIFEWVPFHASPEQAALANVMSQRGRARGSAALGIDYATAQVTAGIVPLPDSADAVPAGDQSD
jgi:nicotinamidase-related amidase